MRSLADENFAGDAVLALRERGHDVAWVHYMKGHLKLARQACTDSLAHAREAEALGELAAAENLLGGIF